MSATRAGFDGGSTRLSEAKEGMESPAHRQVVRMDAVTHGSTPLGALVPLPVKPTRRTSPLSGEPPPCWGLDPSSSAA